MGCYKARRPLSHEGEWGVRVCGGGYFREGAGALAPSNKERGPGHHFTPSHPIEQMFFVTELLQFNTFTVKQQTFCLVGPRRSHRASVAEAASYFAPLPSHDKTHRPRLM